MNLNCAQEDTVHQREDHGRQAKQPPLPEPRAPRGPARRRFISGNEWFDEELSERRVSYESAVPELPAVAVSREPDASINSDLAGNDAVCSTCPSRPSP